MDKGVLSLCEVDSIDAKIEESEAVFCKDNRL